MREKTHGLSPSKKFCLARRWLEGWKGLASAGLCPPFQSKANRLFGRADQERLSFDSLEPRCKLLGRRRVMQPVARDEHRNLHRAAAAVHFARLAAGSHRRRPALPSASGKVPAAPNHGGTFDSRQIAFGACDIRARSQSHRLVWKHATSEQHFAAHLRVPIPEFDRILICRCHSRSMLHHPRNGRMIASLKLATSFSSWTPVGGYSSRLGA